MKPLLYLELRQITNSVKAALRTPKRLIPAVLIALWIAFVFAQDTLTLLGIARPVMPSGRHYLQQAIPIDAIWAVVFIVLTITAAGVIYTALSDGLLIFAPSHVDFLFPTPVNRRHVLAFKLFKDYTKYALFSGLVFGMVGSPLYHVLGVPVYPDLLLSWLGSICLIVFVMNLTHTLNVVATAGPGRLRIARVLVQAAIFAAVLIVAATAVVRFAWTSDAIESVISSTRSSLVRAALAPITWATDVILAPIRGIVNERVELLWLAILAVGSTFLLLGRDEDIYEPALGVSARAARVRDAIRSGDVIGARIRAVGWRGRGSFNTPPVPPFGRGASALLWKSIVVKLRTSGARLLVVMCVPVIASVIIGAAVKLPEVRRVVPVAMPYVAWILALLGQQELRGELRLANLTKAMPISPFRFILVQTFHEWLPVVAVTMISAVSLFVFVADTDPAVLWLSAVTSIVFGFTCVAVISIPVLLYPDSRDKVQDLIAHILSFFLAGIALVPTAVVWLIAPLVDIDISVASLAVVLVNVPIAVAGVLVSGALFARFDPTSD